MESCRDVCLALLLGDVLHDVDGTCLRHPRLEDTAGCDDNTGCLSLHRLVLVRTVPGNSLYHFDPLVDKVNIGRSK